MNWKLVFILVLLGLPGVIASSWLAIPLLAGSSNLPLPLEILQLVTSIQSMVFVLAAATIGALLAPRVGVATPVISAAISNGKVLIELNRQLVPGVLGGCFGAVVINMFFTIAPASLASIQPEQSLPLAVRVLYGGVTEEILVRWGLMTALSWAGWRVFKKDSQKPPHTIIWTAIVLSALLFGALHVPSIAHFMPVMPFSVLVYITIGNAIFGVAAGYLFWRYGLEAAIMAHVLAHIISYFARG